MKRSSGRSDRATARQRSARAVSCVRRLVNSLGESARGVERSTGLTNAQLFLLHQLGAENRLSINELAARALTQQSTVSLLVRKLEDAGYARRERSADDARRVLVALTAKGRGLMKRAPSPPMSRMLDAFDTMTGRDVDALVRGIAALLRAMKTSGDSDPLFEPKLLRRRAWSRR